MTAPRQSGLAALLATLALALAACGTTVNLHGKQAQGLNGNGLTATGAGSSGTGAAGGEAAASGTGSGPGGAGTNGAAGSASALGGSSTQAGAVAGGTTAGSGPTAGRVPANAPGVTATKIYIGVETSSQAADADRAIGAAGAAPSYQFSDVMNAVIKYANSHGAFAGRQMEALYYDYNVTTDTDTQDQSACAHWTQDNKVFAIGGLSEIRRQCAEKAGAIAIGAGSATTPTYKKYPHLLDAEYPSMDSNAVVTTNGLFNAGYFAGKLGMVTWDDPDYRYTMTQGYLPTLASHGITPTDTVYITVPQAVGALGDMSSAVSSAVTKFKAEGIDHVIIQDGHAGVWAGTGLTLEWMNQAKSQMYKPRYGQNASNSPGWSGLPSDQMDKAVAIDFGDYDPKNDAGWHTNAARDLCFKIEADAGMPVQSSNANDEGLASQACDEVFFLQRVINSLPSITADSFVRAVGQLGTSFQPALTYGSKFGSGQRDANAMVRTEDYSADCQCLTYRGPPFYTD